MLLRNFELAGFAPGTLCADTVCAGGATGWLNVDVPQDVHTALLVHGLLKDPRYFANDEKAVWVEQYTWVYRTTIFCTAVQPRTQNILFCEGLDTYCVVYVNGLSAGRTENMLVPHTLDITALLHSGDNELAFIFLPMPEQAARSLPTDSGSITAQNALGHGKQLLATAGTGAPGSPPLEFGGRFTS